MTSCAWLTGWWALLLGLLLSRVTTTPLMEHSGRPVAVVRRQVHAIPCAPQYPVRGPCRALRAFGSDAGTLAGTWERFQKPPFEVASLEDLVATYRMLRGSPRPIIPRARYPPAG